MGSACSLRYVNDCEEKPGSLAGDCRLGHMCQKTIIIPLHPLDYAPDTSLSGYERVVWIIAVLSLIAQCIPHADLIPLKAYLNYPLIVKIFTL